MRLRNFILLSLILAFITSGCMSQKPEGSSANIKGDSNLPKGLENFKIVNASEVYGLLIGVNTYGDNRIKSTGVAGNDVGLMKDLLIVGGVPQENVISVLDNDATLDGIKTSVDKLIANTKDKTSSTAVVYFSGMGSAKVEDGSMNEAFILASDTNLDSVSDTAYSIAKLNSKLNEISGKAIAIFDTSFNGKGRSVIEEGTEISQYMSVNELITKKKSKKKEKRVKDRSRGRRVWGSGGGSRWGSGRSKGWGSSRRSFGWNPGSFFKPRSSGGNRFGGGSSWGRSSSRGSWGWGGNKRHDDDEDDDFDDDEDVDDTDETDSSSDDADKVMFIFAANVDEAASKHPDKNYGLFTYSLVDTLASQLINNNDVSISTAFQLTADYIKTNTPAVKQKPQTIGSSVTITLARSEGYDAASGTSTTVRIERPRLPKDPVPPRYINPAFAFSVWSGYGLFTNDEDVSEGSKGGFNFGTQLFAKIVDLGPKSSMRLGLEAGNFNLIQYKYIDYKNTTDAFDVMGVVDFNFSGFFIQGGAGYFQQTGKYVDRITGTEVSGEETFSNAGLLIGLGYNIPISPEFKIPIFFKTYNIFGGSGIQSNSNEMKGGWNFQFGLGTTFNVY